MMHGDTFLAQAVLIFGAGLVIAWMFRILRAPAAIGYLFAGVVIGPSGLRLITAEGVEQFTELGLVMLLFTVGLELSPEPLIRAGRRLIVAALAQIAVTGAAAFAILELGGALSPGASIILAAGVALSSTAIVLKQLSESGQTGTSAGMLITGILLLQDVFVILLMIFLPLLAPGGGGGWMAAALRGVGSVVGLVVATLLGRYLLPLLLKAIIQRGGRELTTLFAVVAALAGAGLAGWAGWSWPLGACIAGLILSQTDLRHQLFAEIMPFRDVLNALFFISLGMLVDMPDHVDDFRRVGVAVIVTLAGKMVLTAVAVRLSGWPLRLSVACGLGLCTVSEFAYVLARESAKMGILPADLMNDIIAYIVGTMMLGAIFFPLAGRASLLALRLAGRSAEGDGEASHGEAGPVDHVIVVGYGLNGQNLSRVLSATRIPFCVVEMNQVLVQRAREAGHRVIIGDAARISILAHAGLSKARALVVAINDQEATRRIVAQARHARADLYILTRTRYVSEIEVLRRLGAQQVIPEEFETSIEIFSHVLKHFCIPDNVIEAQVEMVRSGNYGMLRGRPVAATDCGTLLGLLEATATQTYLIEPGSRACGRTMRELNLRAETGVTIIAVVRGGRPTTNPPADFMFAAGDVLVLFGEHATIDRAKGMLGT